MSSCAFATPSSLPSAASLSAGTSKHIATNKSHTSNPQMKTSSTTQLSQSTLSRRAFLFTAISTATATLLPSISQAASVSSLSGDYAVDAAAVLADMRVACELARGSPGIAESVSKTRREMNDFVALYRRNGKVSGSPSFSTLYTAINTLSGHYASYGNSYPVPEKRKKRLIQQFTDVDRALNRGR